MCSKIEILETAIEKMQQVKHLLDKELKYDYSITDELENIIEALQFDLEETQSQQED